jgi:hypothetical protein
MPVIDVVVGDRAEPVKHRQARNVDNSSRIWHDSAPSNRENSMSKAQVRSFFEHYAAAFSALDVEGILDHFAFPCQIVGEKGGQAYADRASIEADMSGFTQFYAGQNLAWAELARLEYQSLSQAFGLAHVHWRLRQENGEAFVDFETTYVLRMNRESPAIIGVLGHTEDSQWQRKGLAVG